MVKRHEALLLQGGEGAQQAGRCRWDLGQRTHFPPDFLVFTNVFKMTITPSPEKKGSERRQPVRAAATWDAAPEDKGSGPDCTTTRTWVLLILV